MNAILNNWKFEVVGENQMGYLKTQELVQISGNFE